MVSQALPASGWRRAVGMAAMFVAAAGATVLPAGVLSVAATPAVAAVGDKDQLIFRDGRIISGKVLEETDTRVKFLVTTGGISAERWFEKADLLKVHRAAATEPATPAAPAEPAATGKPAGGGAAKADPQRKPAEGASKVYVVELKGKFGEQITQTPMRDAVKDAKKNNADVLIFVLDNEWAANELEELPDDAAAFDQLFRAEEITPIFVDEIPREWEKQPKIVFWVKQAMGGACFLPFISRNIYMSSDARIGGIGNLSTMFGSTGDEVVRQKQYSLRMAHAEGWANIGGYDGRIIKAMARVEYILSYKMDGGTPVLLERMPEAPDEILLTDDAASNSTPPRADTIQELARGQGNDVLTLTADVARKLRVSQGTADTLDDLLFAMGISRNHERVDKASDRIMTGWAKALEGAKRDLRRLWTEFQEVQVQPPGDYGARSRARGQRLNKIDEMQKIMKRFEEALTPQFYGQYNIPPSPQLDIIKEQIRQEQMADKR